jgi:hypothetical protein
VLKLFEITVFINSSNLFAMRTNPDEIEPIDEESQFLIDQLYLSTPTTMIMPDGQTAEVPEEGNIGLLAFGYRGIIAWRKKREEIHGLRIYSPYMEAIQKLNNQIGESEDEK